MANASEPRNTRDRTLLSNRLLDLGDEAWALATRIRQESADQGSMELLHLRAAHDSAVDLVRELRRAAQAAREGEQP